MLFRQIFVWFTVFFTFVSPAFAEEDVYMEAGVTYYSSHLHDTAFLAKQLYVEKEAGGGWVVFGMVYHDEYFKEAQIGIAKYLSDDLEVGVGVGRARSDDVSYLVVSPWAEFNHDDVHASLLAEFYPDDAPFYKGSVTMNVTSKVEIGFYGETGLGIGPKVSYSVSDSVKVWSSVPVIDRQDIRMVIGISFEF